jgi:hypothetical protein
MLFKINMMSFKRHIKILKCILMLFDQTPQNYQVMILKLLKLIQAKVSKDAIILILMLFVIKDNLIRLTKFL